MASSQRIGTQGTRIFSAVIALLGIVIVARTVAAGGGPLSLGILLGIGFVLIGAGRLYLSLRASS